MAARSTSTLNTPSPSTLPMSLPATPPACTGASLQPLQCSPGTGAQAGAAWWAMQRVRNSSSLDASPRAASPPSKHPPSPPSLCARALLPCSCTLVVESADSAVFAWLNGTALGYSQDSRLPAEWTVTSALAPAGQSNTLVLKVLKWSDGSYLEDQDMWRLPGLHRWDGGKEACISGSLCLGWVRFATTEGVPAPTKPPSTSRRRDVYLQVKPGTHIRDFAVRTPLTFEPDGSSAPHTARSVSVCMPALGEGWNQVMPHSPRPVDAVHETRRAFP